MAKALTLRQNFSWTFVGNGVYAASQWGILVVLAKLGTPAMVGQFALGLAITAPIIMFANLQLRAVQATDARREYAFADYLGLRLLTTVGALGVIALLLALSGFEAQTAAVIGFIALAKAFEALSDVFFGLLQQRERMDRIALSLMIEGPVTLVVMGVIMLLTGDVVLAVAGMALVWGLQLVLYDVRSGVLILREQRERLRPRFQRAHLQRLAWLALPLGFVTMLNSLTFNIPRYVIQDQLGEQQLGVFAAISYLMVAGLTVVGALGQSASPRLAAYASNSEWAAFRALLAKLVGISAGVGSLGIIAALVAGEALLNLFYGPAYAVHADLFRVMMVAALLSYTASMLGYALTALRYFRAQVGLNVLYGGVILLAALGLIPHMGLVGGALALCVLFLSQIVLSSLLVFRRP